MSGLVSLDFWPEFTGAPINFDCSVTNDNYVSWNVEIPKHIESYGCIINYISSNNLNYKQTNWQYLDMSTTYIAKDTENRQMSGLCNLESF
jgi:hypothetical protein